MLSSAVCTSTQLKSPELQRWMGRLGQPSMLLHRKVWEWAYIAQVLDERGMLEPGKRGLGFAVGKEPLVALFASMGCDIVATDLDEATAVSVGWTKTNQHARDVSALNEAGLCEAEEFARRVSFRVVDMNHMPSDLTGFDFVWSSCSIEHLGDIGATEEFLSRSMNCLKPGGVAVHTTEYNLTSNVATVESGVTVILRKCDIERMAVRLRDESHEIGPIDFEVGDAADDQVILHPPYEGQPCLKIWIGGHAATSIGIVVKAGPNAGSASVGSGHSTPLPAERVRESNAFLPRLANWLSPARAGASRKIEAAPSPKNGLGADDLRDVYRLLLNREPDPTGFEHFSRLIQAGTIATRRELVDIIIGSTEFGAARHGENEMLEVELDGYSLFVRSNDRDIGFTISRSGVHEPHVTSVVRELLSKGQVFADVGANVGYFMALGAHIVGASGRVIAVEPMDKNLQLLYATVWRNAFANVEIHPFAASEKAALLPMATGPRTSNGQVVLGDGGRTIPSLFAQSRPMDELLRLLPRLDLLKIDIEGHELMALRGFEKGLARHRPRIITEFHPKCMRENSGIDPAEYLKFLFSYSNNAVVLHSDSTRVVCDDADAVMQEWQAADRRLASGGTTHVDLLVTPR